MTSSESTATELENADAIAKKLPAGVTLEQKTTDKEGDTSRSVRDQLAWLGATLKGSKIVDRAGRDIAFYKPKTTGSAMVREKEYLALLKKHTVVLLAPAQ